MELPFLNSLIGIGIASGFLPRFSILILFIGGFFVQGFFAMVIRI